MNHYIPLLNECFPGIEKNILRWEALGFSWGSGKLFLKEEGGNVISHVSLLERPVLIDGKWQNVGALHGICTKNTHREKGLASALIQEALEFANGRCSSVLLFTEIPAFYEKFSFHSVPEYRFHLTLSHAKGKQHLRPLTAPQDHELLLRCFRERAPLSQHLWIKDNGSIAAFNTLFATYPTYWSLYYSSAIDGLISFEIKDKTLHLYDVVAAKLPSLDLLLDHLPEPINDIYFYFSPDQFTDKAAPEPHLYDHGHLMVHGDWNTSHPFTIPPLSRC